MSNGKGRPARRGAVPASASPDGQLRGEVAAIAVAAFSVLSLVALITDQGAVLQWWRGLLVGALGAGAALVPPALALAAITFWSPDIRARLLMRSEEHTSELQSRENLVCRLLLEKK